MRKIVVFSDMDGTLLDHDTFSVRPAVSAVDLLVRRGFPLVLVSSKTASEIRRWMKMLFIEGPFICENGCGIVIPKGYFRKIPEGGVEEEKEWRIPLGIPVGEVREKLRQAAAEAGVPCRVFGDMSFQEISRLSGLKVQEELDAARDREFEEPFILEGEESFEQLLVPAEKRGLVITRGGRFCHAAGGCDKGKAVRVLAGLFREKFPDILTVAVGDSQNDLAMLQSVDKGYLVRKPDGSYDPAVPRGAAQRIRGTGPKGFREAIEEVTTIG